MAMTWEDIVRFARHYPHVEESTSYGEPSLKVGRKMLTRLRVADNAITLKDVAFEERDMLIEMRPDVFFVEPHYQNYPIVLARLDALSLDHVAGLLERRWRNIAPKKVLKAWDAD